MKKKVYHTSIIFALISLNQSYKKLLSGQVSTVKRQLLKHKSPFNSYQKLVLNHPNKALRAAYRNKFEKLPPRWFDENLAMGSANERIDRMVEAQARTAHRFLKIPRNNAD